MRKHILKIVFLLVAVLIAPNTVWAEPEIRSVTPVTTFTHGALVTIGGRLFGTKTQPAPYIWDDASGSDPLQKWDVVYPFTNDAAFRLAYRAPSQVTRANGATGGVALPHSHIQKYICGAHYRSGNMDAYSGWNVAAVKNNQEGQTYTYISYYRTIDPHWYLHANCQAGQEYRCDHNFKEYDYAEGYGIYGNMNNIYFGNESGSSPFDNLVWGGMYIEGMNLTINSVNPAFMTWYQQYNTVFSSVGVPGVGQGWQKVELILKHNSLDGFHRIFQDNLLVWDVSLDDDGLAAGPRVETVFGGFARESGNAEEYKNNWRYYADVYYDHSLARVMLANNARYDLATITEPQIISTWSDGSISATLNLGRLPDSGTVYLFVFDAGNVHNQTGYLITLGSGPPANLPPDAPTGLTVQ
jgi:hypothetical protein